MSKLNFSKGKFSKFISSKGFYAALAVCLVGAGAATWLAVDRTMSDIQDNNAQILKQEDTLTAFPQIEEAETKKQDIPKQQTPSTSSSVSGSSSGQASTSSAAPAQSEQQEASQKLPTLAYSLPVSGDIIGVFSGEELVRNTTMNDWRTHNGVDITAEKGTEILAAADGTVAEITNDPLWGTVMVIDHLDGNQTIYCGLDNNLPVSVGDTVLVRQVIGKLGAIPSESEEKSHLHFAMKNDGAWVDPLDKIAKAS